MTEISKVQQMPQTTEAQGTPVKTSKMKPQAKMHIWKGNTVQTVEQDGSEAQKIVAKAFDTDINGKYDAGEAANFNDYSFALDKGNNELRMHNNKTKCTAIIKSDEYLGLVLGAQLAVADMQDLKGGQIKYDIDNNRYTYDGVEGAIRTPSWMSDQPTVTIKNSSISQIDARDFKGKLNIINTRSVGFWGISPTQISVHPNNKLNFNASANSQVSIKCTEI